MESLYNVINADKFFKEEFGCYYHDIIEKISREYSDFGNSNGFHKYGNYAIIGTSKIYHYCKYINWLNKNKIPICCINYL
jgi:hypothetical protein